MGDGDLRGQRHFVDGRRDAMPMVASDHQDFDVAADDEGDRDKQRGDSVDDGVPEGGDGCRAVAVDSREMRYACAEGGIVAIGRDVEDGRDAEGEGERPAGGQAEEYLGGSGWNGGGSS